MPAPLWIKICANTNLADALLAAELGADAAGFVFAPSPRQVTPAQVAAITPHLPASLEKVGVFIASSPSDVETIAQSAEQAHLTAIQLHGTINLPLAAALTRRLGPAFKIIHTAHWKLDEDDLSAQRITAQLATLAATNTPDRILIDAKVGDATGGLGISFNWSRAAAVLSSQPSIKVIAAGGLTPENVAEAIAALHPYGVDVASGVELSPGRKDPAKLQAFMQKARGAV